MSTTTLVQCLVASVLFLLPVSDARASPRNVRYAAAAPLERRATGWTYAGCYVDAIGTRTLTTNPGTTGGTAALTIELCESTCLGLGFSFAGAEYGGECYCGNEFANGGALAPDGETGCNMACNGNATETCGGSYRLSVYQYGTASASSSSSIKSSSTSSSKAATSSSVSVSSSKASSSLSSSKASSSLSSSSLKTSSLSSSKVSSSFSSASSKTSSLSSAKASSSLSSSSKTSSLSSSSIKITSPLTTSSKPTSSSSSSKSSSKSSSVLSSSTSKPLSSSTLVTSSSSKSTSASVVSSSTSKPASSSIKSSSVSTSKPASSSATLSSSSKTSTSLSSSKLSSSISSSKTSSSAVLSSSSKPSSSSLVVSTSKPVSSSISKSSAKASSSQAVQAPGWSALGCYTDGGGSRALTTQTYLVPGPTFTIELCQAACLSLGFTLAGVEYSQECYCGNAIANGNILATDGGCTMTCNGNTAEICGGPNRINIYSYSSGSSGTTTAATTTKPVTSTSAVATSSVTAIAGWIPYGCYSDVVGARTLNTQIYTIAGAAMTVELCTAACKTAGFTLAGLEYGGECYCDTAIMHTGALVTGGCTMPCNGNAAEFCGGPNQLNVWALGPQPTGTVTSTTNTAVATTTAVGVATTLPTGWTYRGCWLDQQFGRILSAQSPDLATMTIEKCVQACVGLGYTIAGLEYFTQCYCGNAMINQAVLATSATECNTACGGNAAEICGGGDRMSIYSNQTTLKVTPVPTIQKTGLPGSWSYTGCIVDDAVIRTFPYQLDLYTNNTAEACLNQCAKFGYGAGGMEYGEQCFCGDVADVIKAGATALQPDTTCNTVCTGNESYYCGGPNRIAYYTWTGASLNSWDFPTGAAAGSYEFLIGNVMIPLIATPGVNGKITFLEKFGTEPADNSTGAYELDLNLLDDFEKAWRPMNVKTDVFCAAGLTLPDKVGRQLNIGGWANDATFGVRLYWPDGSPGVWGVNDWQENVKELSLKAGRWYPTAMTMANGSILVVGGEEGSNGAPVPSLEILPLPKGADVLYCEWLDRTDPYNLYPYLAVLPTGAGIVSLYYNEARILDEVTLETKRVLPNMPGAVNNFLGGRTYPFEGTAMLMPQYAPYTDPLTVMVCGGSTPGPEIALDNCVSIQPEVVGANWTIERMPSKRVISCITALPDGTYIINNGGQQGRAGFGLAIDPNLNAVLYDPSKPVNHRMSVMANTTIARLYHSESVLLQDGRVLVTGSDPEDVRFPQEYRVEVYNPPYLLSGLTRPTYVLGSADVAYGKTFTVTVALHQGTTANMRISLMAAVSSTHGNSMGQRTIFPAFKCEGNVCTVTAPPNAHVCPPAWHMLFVLDGPTPSVAQWIRIGGDPASLGNWPDFPDFDVPGI